VRKLVVLIFVAVAFLLTGVGLVATSLTSPAHSTKVGSPNFVCIAAWNFGICIGPPTKQG